jgi:single-strand DNA-binding protein
MGLNKVMIIGNLGRDPELRYTPSGQSICQFSVAVSRNFKKGDEWQEETEWFNVVQWGQGGERAAEKLRKGNKVYVEGRLQTRSYEDKEGKKVFRTELIADRFESLTPTAAGSAPEGFEPNMQPAGAPSGGRQRDRQPEYPEYDELDSLPF